MGKIDKVVQNAEFTINKVDTVLNSRLVIAVIMIIDGIGYINNYDRTLVSMSKGIAEAVFIASALILITNLTTNKKDLKSILIPIIMMIISVIVRFNPNIISFNFRILFALIIIINALINIFNIRKLDRLSASLSFTKKKIKKDLQEDEKSKEYDFGVVLRKITYLLDPVGDLIEKTNKHVHIYILLNNISIILGILLLLNNNTTIVLCGIILIYTGLIDLFVFLRSVRLARKNKEALKQLHKEYVKERYVKEKKQ